MQIWKKNYLLTFTLFLVVFNISLFFITAKYSESELQYEMETAMSEYTSISNTLARVYEGDNESLLDYLCSQYAKSKMYLKIQTEDRLIRSTLPSDISQENNKAEVRTLDGNKYICITGNKASSPLNITVLKDISHMRQKQSERLLTALAIDFLLSMFIGIMLYVTMKQINKPVSNLSHELRTPLTNIQGYAQYLMAARTTEEDRFFASEYILKEARNMQAVIDKLLIMGNIRDGSIQKSKISLQKLFEELKEKHPNVQFCKTQRSINGDWVMINALMGNLIANSERGGGQVFLSASDDGIILENKEDFIEKDILKALNRNTRLPEEKIRGHGQGVHLCHEIVKLHKGTLRYQSSKAEGTVITIGIRQR